MVDIKSEKFNGMANRLLCGLLTALLLMTSAACGRMDNAAADGETPGKGAADVQDEQDDEGELDPSVFAAEGQVLNIYCPNDKFKSVMAGYYPCYEEVDAITGKIGDVRVVWNVIPNNDDIYLVSLDAAFSGDEDLDEDEMIDLFLLEEDYAFNYIEEGHAMPLSDLGITDEELSGQFPYTRAVASDSEGVQRAASWQCCPGVLYYNRDIALEVFETDDPEYVQSYVKDWDSFNETAGIMRAAGYHIVPAASDLFKPYIQNAGEPWVVEDALNIDQRYVDWGNAAASMVENGQTGVDEIFSEAWQAGMKSDTPVFCYLASFATMSAYMHETDEGYVANKGRWGVAPGPAGFFSGGLWLCAAEGTDNKLLVADIIRRFTCNTGTMRKIMNGEGEFVNNRQLANEAAESDLYSSAFGGQNPARLYLEAADRVKRGTVSIYDYDCMREFSSAMQNHFEGNASFGEALDLFKTTIIERYPELSAQ